MQPISINEAFTCLHCGHKVEKAESGCRNHCPSCLYSRHVDDHVPGDRASSCLGLMKPIEVIPHKKKGLQLIHECTVCHKQQPNKTAPEDNHDLLIELTVATNKKRAKLA